MTGRPDSDPLLVAGLGNPGRRYAGTRHNVGFWVVSRCLDRAGLTPSRKFGADVATGHRDGRRVIWLRPLQYMNVSGPPVRDAAEWHEVEPGRILVVHDDLDLEPGDLRLRRKGSSGGHRGVQSIIDALDTDRFHRLKIGIGRPEGPIDPADYVLMRPPEEEGRVLSEAADRAVEAVHIWLDDGIDEAMARFHG